MQPHRLYIAASPALAFAGKALAAEGFPLTSSPENATHILLPVPTKFIPEGLPPEAVLIGGNLPQTGRQTIDLLADPVYLAQNAAITAQGAVKTALNALPVCLCECRTLILGWGRVAQCLSHLLKGMGGQVTVAARREDARAMAAALGFATMPLEGLSCQGFRLVFNTIPAPLPCTPEDFSQNCVKIDLASRLSLPGEDVIWARGLPGKEFPESAGRLIARRAGYHLMRTESHKTA